MRVYLNVLIFLGTMYVADYTQNGLLALIIGFLCYAIVNHNINSVRINGMNIQCITNPSVEVQLAAVKQNSYAIEHIDNPSEAVQIAAVQQKWITGKI